MYRLLVIALFAATSFGAQSTKGRYPALSVIFTSDFNNDSILVYTSSQRKSMRITTQPSLGASEHGMTFTIRETDTTIFVQHVHGGKKDSVRVKQDFPFLYISYTDSTFGFRFTQAPVFFE